MLHPIDLTGLLQGGAYVINNGTSLQDLHVPRRNQRATPRQQAPAATPAHTNLPCGATRTVPLKLIATPSNARRGSQDMDMVPQVGFLPGSIDIDLWSPVPIGKQGWSRSHTSLCTVTTHESASPLLDAWITHASRQLKPHPPLGYMRAGFRTSGLRQPTIVCAMMRRIFGISSLH